MKIQSLNSALYGQNFGSISKIVYTTGGATKTCIFSKSKKSFLPQKVGEFIVKANGDVAGKRTFANGATITFDTSHGTLLKEPYVPYEYKFPDGKKGFSRRGFVFDLAEFKKHMAELTTLKGIKKYLEKIESAPKITRNVPCS